ncbi:MauE/DoxX family redox-associated membrane protein [Nonomuraea sp. NPDC048916]|uniref:MauE/DoxX family redox-associated membrane protein n=1 Tax=Nonomuraea sp. NPDC048916 TaxID=3154232 RepID=UPI0033D19ADE
MTATTTATAGSTAPRNCGGAATTGTASSRATTVAELEYVALACRCLIGAVFLISAVSKVRDRSSREAFARTLSALVPAVGSVRLGYLVVAVELLIAIAVALPVTAVWGLGAAAGALMAFSAALWLALRRSVTVSCGCFGWSDTPVSRVHLVRNAVLVASALAGATTHVVAGDTTLLPGGVVVAVGAALVVFIGVVFTDDLASLFAPASPPARS